MGQNKSKNGKNSDKDEAVMGEKSQIDTNEPNKDKEVMGQSQAHSSKI